MAEQSATLSAKQVATKLGTDAKTFRRFLRSSSCTIEPVGQGGRYEFTSTDLEPLKKQFLGWRKPSPNEKAPNKGANPTKRAKTEAPAPRKKHKIDDDPLEIRMASTIAQRQQGAEMANDIEKRMEETEHLQLDDREPTDEELAELEDLDLEELDA